MLIWQCHSHLKMHNLNLLEMMSDSEYKEHHRLQMVEWSTELRKKDPNCFLRASIKENQADQYPVWILTDARRDCDIEYFEQTELFKKLNTKVIRLRIAASDQVRQQRGYVFTPSIDDAPTECGLDHYTKWDHVIENNDLSEEQLLEHLKPILDQCQF